LGFDVPDSEARPYRRSIPFFVQCDPILDRNFFIGNHF